MSLSRHLCFPCQAALAVCAVALMVWANQSVGTRSKAAAKYSANDNNTTASSLTGFVSPTDTEKTASTAKAALVAQLAPNTTTATVQQVLPQLTQDVADWRTFFPQKITIAPHADLTMDFEMTAVRQENGRTVWRGRNALTGAFLVTVATQNDWHAVLEIPAASSFEFHIAGQTALVTEKYETGACGASRHLADADLAQGTVVLSPDPNSDPDSNGGGGTSGCSDSIDVLFFYDAATFAANGNSRAAMDTAIAARVESANLVLENSRIKNFHWRYVAAYQIPEYTVPADMSGKLEGDLQQITFTDNATGQFVAEKCALHGVDQTVVFVTGSRDFAGVAWVPTGEDALAHYAAVVWNSNYTVLAHELAHNFGCHHDRTTEKATSDDSRPSYGFRFSLNGSDTGTVMSYAPSRVPYFSNPEVSYKGIALGVAEGQLGAANNAHILSEKAVLMKTHGEANPKPIITVQPEATSVVRGSSLNLSVFAAGEGLAYQWRKNGKAIAGATSSVYTKSGTSDEDIGSYDVIVTNDAGNATSTSATVAVASPAVEAAATNSQSGGGGGGGAPSDWFFGALALLGLARVIRRKR